MTQNDDQTQDHDEAHEDHDEAHEDHDEAHEGEAPRGREAAAAGPLGPLRRYLRDSKNLLHSVLLVMPLFGIYQIGVLTTGGVQNGVDFITPWLFHKVFQGVTLHYVMFNVGLLVAAAGLAVILKGFRRFDPWLYVWVGAESLLYSVTLGGVVSWALAKAGLSPSLQSLQANEAGQETLAQLGAGDHFILSLGAGFYEELVFRLALMGGSVWILKGGFLVDHARRLQHAGHWPEGEGLGVGSLWKRALSGPDDDLPPLPWVTQGLLVGLAVVGSSLLFSGIHYIGPLGDPWSLYSFSFRALAGVLFASLYAARGFAVAVYTHALYDVIVLVF